MGRPMFAFGTPDLAGAAVVGIALGLLFGAPLSGVYALRARKGERARRFRTGGAERLLTVPRVEMTEGKLFNSDEDRLHVLALLLESVGTDAAIRLAPLELWREALKEAGERGK